MRQPGKWLAALEPGEVLWVLALNAQHRLLSDPIVVTRGLVNQSPVHAREVFRAAIAAGAVAVILVHGSSSGDSAWASVVLTLLSTRDLQPRSVLLGYRDYLRLGHVIVGHR